MGYYKYLGDHEFTIQASQFDAVIERWKEFEKENGIPFPSASVFYRYPNDEPVEKSVPDIFEEFGFELAYDDEAMTIEGWEGKAGYEEEYITAIADLIDEGWYLEWTGEDDDRWRQTRKTTITGETVYVEPKLEYRLRDITALLDEYDNAYFDKSGDALTEVRAVGPIIDAIRTLIKDLS